MAGSAYQLPAYDDLLPLTGGTITGDLTVEGAFKIGTTPIAINPAGAVAGDALVFNDTTGQFEPGAVSGGGGGGGGEMTNIGINTAADAAHPLVMLGNGGSRIVGLTQNQYGGVATMELLTEDAVGALASRIVLRGGTDTADIEFLTGARGAESVKAYLRGTDGVFVANNGVEVGSSAAKIYLASVDRLTVRSESVNRVADFASYGMYLPRTGQTYNLYLAGSLKVGHSESAKIDVNGHVNATHGKFTTRLIIPVK